MGEIRHATVKTLAHIIRDTGKQRPYFAYFLGAGASRQSGVITTSEMIRVFKAKIIERECPKDRKKDDEKITWLEAQDWYRQDGSEYSKCFERFAPTIRRRQWYVES